MTGRVACIRHTGASRGVWLCMEVQWVLTAGIVIVCGVFYVDGRSVGSVSECVHDVNVGLSR